MSDEFLWIAIPFALAFAGAFGGIGIYLFRQSLSFRKKGIATELNVLDMVIIQSGGSEPGTQIIPIYKVLEGPRAGDIVRADGGDPNITTTVLNLPEDQKPRYTGKFMQIGENRQGWVHQTKPIARAKKDQALQITIAAGLILVGIVAIGIAVFLLVS
ncbi:MAG: hypothetical protein CMK09_09980 [Ponticaulis sp.]|nr:hypothetical protein [Ponticaulis sp.]|tara:strand:+ start:15840 stop:16313 length:474 start_codon:yes stop_codon:yes gene_type:complete